MFNKIKYKIGNTMCIGIKYTLNTEMIKRWWDV